MVILSVSRVLVHGEVGSRRGLLLSLSVCSRIGIEIGAIMAAGPAGRRIDGAHGPEEESKLRRFIGNKITGTTGM